MKRVLNQIIPFLMMGMAIVALIFGIVLLSYLFIFGAILGLILFTAIWIRNKFFPPKKIIKPEKKSGRIIDSDDWRKL